MAKGAGRPHNGPSTTGRPSGKGRGNNPPSKSSIGGLGGGSYGGQASFLTPVATEEPEKLIGKQIFIAPLIASFGRKKIVLPYATIVGYSEGWYSAILDKPLNMDIFEINEIQLATSFGEKSKLSQISMSKVIDVEVKLAGRVFYSSAIEKLILSSDSLF